MFRIGIIGTENTHAEAFATLFRDEAEFSDMKIVAVGGIYPESNQRMSEEFGIDMIAEKPEDMLGKVDAVMITARDGIYHAPFARPFLEAGIPMFIDKPFTVDTQEAIAFAKEAKARGIKLMGGSTLKCTYDAVLLQNEAKQQGEKLVGGTVAAPVMLDSPYSDFFFYASHLTELSLMIFGKEPKSVTALRNGKSVTAVVEYENYSVTNTFMGGCMKYFAQVFSTEGIYSRQIDLSFASKIMAQRFAEMLRHGTMPESYEDLIRPVVYMNAVKQSYLTQKPVAFEKIEL